MKTLSDKPLNLDPKGAEIESVNFYSGIMQDLYRDVLALAQKQDNILLVGEAGTGKHHTARLMHSLGSCSEEPFFNIFCNSLEETIQKEMEQLSRMVESGTFESSGNIGINFTSGGTLFFKSFSALSPPSMRILVKLLYIAQQMSRHMEEGRNFKIIVSIKNDAYTRLSKTFLWNEAMKKLNPVVIHLPPLRRRCEDIILLIDQFLIEYARKNKVRVHAISPRAVYKCISYDWPGNIRQLKNTIEHAATVVPSGSVITCEMLPFSIDWKSPHSHISKNKEDNQSFLRAIKLLLDESELKDQEFGKKEHKYRISSKGQDINLP